MKTLIIYASIHHGNTERVAEAVAEVLNAKSAKANDVNINELSGYDLIGFGSGIYFGKHYKSLFDFIDRLPNLENKKAFIFSTSGVRKIWFFHDFDKPLREKLLEKGFDTFGAFRFIGGISKGRPNEKDLEQSRNFAQDLLKELSEAYGI